MNLEDFQGKSLEELEELFFEPPGDGSEALLACGLAARTIQDKALFPDDFKDFTEYIKGRLKFSRIHVHRRIKAAELLVFLQDHFDELPQSESAARPLVKLSRANQLKVWGEVLRVYADDKWAPGKDKVERVIARLGLDRVY